MTEPAGATNTWRLIQFLRSTVPPVDDPGRKPNRAALAALRRSAGREPGSVPETFPYVEPNIPRDAQREFVDAAYLAAGIFGLHQKDWPLPKDGEREGNRSFGASLRRVRQRDDGSDDEGVERRFVALLDTRIDELPRHLRGLVTLLMARNRDVPIDYTQLLRDLADWDHPDRYVQKRWADGFWRGSAIPGATSTEAGDEPEDTTNYDNEEA